MALIHCKECGNEISSKAKACPKCGSPIKKSTSASGCLGLGCVGILGIILIVAISGNHDAVGERSPVDLQYSAKHFAEEIVTKNLKAPSTAKFADTRVLDVRWDEKKKANYCLVQMEVDAQNAFGAMIRSRFLVCLQLNREGDKCEWFASRACQEFDHVPGNDDIQAMKLLNDWPEPSAPAPGNPPSPPSPPSG